MFAFNNTLDSGSIFFKQQRSFLLFHFPNAIVCEPPLFSPTLVVNGTSFFPAGCEFFFPPFLPFLLVGVSAAISFVSTAASEELFRVD